MKKLHRILLAAAVGVVLLAVDSAWLTGTFGSYTADVWGMLPGVLGLALISYAAFQVHEGLMALFWGFIALGTFTVHLLSGVSEGILEGTLALLLLGVPGILLMGYGIRLLFKSRLSKKPNEKAS